ncbi:Uncharacterised protein [Salmonella enterica subsp. enterica serovar Typhi]|nr:Uncharacterised protein [Salmonella enterica subsp. enterica serovar Typhi]
MDKSPSQASTTAMQYVIKALIRSSVIIQSHSWTVCTVVVVGMSGSSTCSP